MGRSRVLPADHPDDATLIGRLRDGDGSAYEQLWQRHVAAALSFARGLAPSHAEDLVSEAFLAVHHQITVAGNGPRTAFRAYLLTTVRNTFYSWIREDRHLVLDPDVDRIDSSNDGLLVLERDATAGELLSAFKSLPDRWQRVLWLSEVEGAKRQDIAAELGIKPNAVSALLKRARRGLRAHWLLQQIPEALREDPAHVARLLPDLITGRRGGLLTGAGRAHLTACDVCGELNAELRRMHGDMSRVTLSIAGFAALGVVLPAAAHASLTAVGVGTAAALLTIGGLTLAAGLAFAPFVGTVTTAVLSGPPPSAEAVAEGSGTSEEGNAESGRDQGSEAEQPEPAGQETSAGSPMPVGRGNTDTGITSHTFTVGSDPNDFYETPSRPPAVPQSSIPAPAGDPSPTLRSGIANPSAASGYLAPVLTGRTAPGARVAVELVRPSAVEGVASDPQHFTVQADAAGDWAFDSRAVSSTAVGLYRYRVWAFTDAETSPVDSGTFSLSSPELGGFEGLTPFEPLPLAESSTTGIVFEVRGPAGGSVCLSSVYSGQSAEIPLDPAGAAVNRIRFLTGGTYLLAFRACEGAYRGPETYVFVDVDDPDGFLFSWFGPDPAETVIELSEP